MVCVDVITTAGALLAVLVVKTQFAGAVLSANHVTRALATTSSASECALEAQFCSADASCLACAEAFDAAIGGACGGTAVETCDELGDFMCCASGGCQDNTAYAAFIGCLNAGVGCGAVDSGVIDGGDGGAIYPTIAPIIAGSIAPIVYGKNTVKSVRQSSGCFNDGFGCGVIDVGTCTSSGGSAGGSDGAATSNPGVTTADGGTTALDDTSATTSDRALPTTESTTATSSGTSPCQAEADACLADAGCVSCMETLDAEDATAAAVCEPPGYDEETATCSEMSEAMCCYVEEGADCVVTNAAMVAFVDCGIATVGCDFSIAGCADGGGSSTLVGGDDATSATSSNRALPTTDNGTSVTDATSSGTTACQAEQDACLVEDLACLSCAEAIAAGTSGVEAACQDADYDDATASCSEKSEVACCSVQEGPECLADPDDLLVVWLDCLAEAEGCDFSITDCADGGDGADGIDVEEDDEQEDTDADAADADADSAAPSATVGGSTAMLVAAAVSLALMNA